MPYVPIMLVAEAPAAFVLAAYRRRRDIGALGVERPEDIGQDLIVERLAVITRRLRRGAVPFILPHREVFVVTAPDREARVVAQALDGGLGLDTQGGLRGLVIGHVAAREQEILPDEQAELVA